MSNAAALTDVLSFRVPHTLKKKFDDFIEKTHRKKSDVLVHWLEEALSLEEWQLREVELGIEEANAGQFASQEEVDRVFKQWL